MKRHLITLLTFAFLSLGDCWAGKAQYLIVNSKDGMQASFALADLPKVLLKEGILTITCGSRTYSLNLAEVMNYKFSEDATGLDEIIKNNNNIQSDGIVIFSKLKANDKVSVFLTDGRHVEDIIATSDGVAIIKLSDLPKGVLILHSNKTDIKIINR